MKIAIIVVTLVLGLIVLPLVLITRGAEKDAEITRQREREWLQFSMQHHCSILRRSGFWDGDTTWQCDGNFQVVRSPN